MVEPKSGHGWDAGCRLDVSGQSAFLMISAIPAPGFPLGPSRITCVALACSVRKARPKSRAGLRRADRYPASTNFHGRWCRRCSGAHAIPPAD